MKSRVFVSLLSLIFFTSLFIALNHLPQVNLQPSSVPQITITPNIASSSAVMGVRTKVSGCTVNGPFPDPECSPGDIIPGVTRDQICVSGYSKSVRDVPQAEKDEVYAEYGILSHGAGEYEVDHIISLELGGSNDISNLFPEAADPRPGFHEKDKVENFLHSEVCSNQISLEEAQREISTNWLEVYKQISN